MAANLGKALLLWYARILPACLRNKLQFYLLRKGRCLVVAAHQNVKDEQCDVKVPHCLIKYTKSGTVWYGVVWWGHIMPHEWPAPARRMSHPLLFPTPGSPAQRSFWLIRTFFQSLLDAASRRRIPTSSAVRSIHLFGLDTSSCAYHFTLSLFYLSFLIFNSRRRFVSWTLLRIEAARSTNCLTRGYANSSVPNACLSTDPKQRVSPLLVPPN